MQVANYQRQHRELLLVVSELEPWLDEARLREGAGPIRRLLATLAGKLTIHLKAEDAVLYPTLASSSRPEVRQTAERFAREMGGLADVFQAYIGRWPRAEHIEAEPARFIEETHAVLRALGERINREENELYPLLRDLQAMTSSSP